MSQLEHFDRVAGQYEALRGADDPAGLERLYEAIVGCAGLRAGEQVLDIGCGTGRTAAALAGSYGARVVGVDPSPGMLAEARAKGVEAHEGSAEGLPFADACFDMALMQLVVQHLDRGRAFAEALRVLRARGRLVIVTTDPAAFPRFWLAQIFPSYVEVERARFPNPERLKGELVEAGFGAVETTRLAEPRRFSRDTALAKLRGRYGSTFDLLPPGEYEAGLERATRDLPDEIQYVLRLAIVVGQR
jgi:ubiquinone/menaquinone biosynthesis C-methylase UbiE